MQKSHEGADTPISLLPAVVFHVDVASSKKKKKNGRKHLIHGKNISFLKSIHLCFLRHLLKTELGSFFTEYLQVMDVDGL